MALNVDTYSGDQFREKLADPSHKMEGAFIQYFLPSKEEFYIGRIREYSVDDKGLSAAFLLQPCIHAPNEIKDEDVKKLMELADGASWEINRLCGHIFPRYQDGEYIKVYSV